MRKERKILVFLWTTFCGGGLMCKIPSSCTCQNGQCISNYDYEDEEFYKKTDTEKIEDVFMMRLEAQKNCDIELSNSIITEKSKEIIHSTCSNMANERKCYVRKDFKILAKSDTAILYFSPFNHKTGWPFFFAKEDGKWKIDMHKMAFGITMGGSGCATGWSWRDDEIVEEFCGYFEEGECPEKR
ncbi:MAG: hypothetical protein KAQ87_03960 [Candidatus Pacebacteria bacterium]|nr:hypothetical protein [Candidatus Paceibacterota bacterium]